MIGKPSNNISLVIYEELKTPKCIKINKSFMRFIIFSVPLVLILSISFSLYLSIHMKGIILGAIKKEPQIIKKLRQEKTVLEDENNELEILNKDLIDKLNTPISQTDNILVFFKKPLGYQDLTKKSPLVISNEKFSLKDNNIIFNFNIENKNPDFARQAGHVFVIMKMGTTINIYPKITISLNDSLTTFNAGEPFSVARFRPVLAKFVKPQTTDDKYFKVLIFSRIGDLITNSTYGPYK